MEVDPTVVRDVVVVLPGIMGSELAVDNKLVWSLQKRTLIRGIVSMGKHLEKLVVPDDGGYSDPDDEGSSKITKGRPPRVTAVRLVRDLHVIPGLWTPVDGYSGLLNFLRSDRFHLVEGDIHDQDPSRLANLIPFPYDWRLSNRVNACRLKTTIKPILDRWRSQPGFGDAKLVIIAHSMGGLVARCFIELEGGAEMTRALVTIGTPHCGAMNSLDTLSQGVSAGLGPVSERMTRLARSLPSLHELLPQYKAIGAGEERALLSPSNYGLNSTMVEKANDFHKQLVEAGTRLAGTYELHKIVGIRQPTLTTASPNGDTYVASGSIDGKSQGGDGTVPRLSAEPTFARGQNVLTVSERHGSLHNTRAALDAIDGLLTRDSIIWEGEEDAETFGVELPDLWVRGDKPPTLRVIDAPNRRLLVTISPSHGVASPPIPLASDGTFDMPTLPAGGYLVKVGSNQPGSASVTVPFVVWDATAL